MKVAFVLDSSIDTELIKHYITECYECSCEFYDISNSYNALDKIKSNLVFVSADINGLCAFEAIGKKRALDFNIVVVASNEKAAIKAFDYGAIHYIVTPIDMLDILRIKERIGLKVPIIAQ